MNILALDLATKTGWALDESGRIESGVQVFDIKRGESPGMRYVRLCRWLDEIGAKAELVIYEQVVPAPAKFGGASAREIAYGLAAHVQRWCAARKLTGLECEHTAVYPSTLKKFATGKGNAKKPDMIAAALKRGWFRPGQLVDDNQVDARWLLEYALIEIVPAASLPSL